MHRAGGLTEDHRVLTKCGCHRVPKRLRRVDPRPTQKHLEMVTKKVVRRDN